MVVAGIALMSSRAGVSAAACTASTCCNVAIPKLPVSTTTRIDNKVCSWGTLPAEIGSLVNLAGVYLTNTQLSGKFTLSLKWGATWPI